jgi:hypothetical protein
MFAGSEILGREMDGSENGKLGNQDMKAGGPDTAFAAYGGRETDLLPPEEKVHVKAPQGFPATPP